MQVEISYRGPKVGKTSQIFLINFTTYTPTTIKESILKGAAFPWDWIH